jgi:CRP-like cAMP-binding protein
VLDGWVKLYRIAPSGVEAVVGVFTKGRSFGEAVAFRGDCYPVAAEAVTECRLLQIRAGLILDTMKARPELCTAMLAATFRHLHSLVTQVEQLKAQTGVQRVAEFLLHLCPVTEGACTVRLPYDKVLIAGRLGMKPESLSRAFARLRDSGVVVKHNHAAIANVARLRTLAEEDRSAAWSKAE